MKVGILTLHRTTNYGATLQAYSLWRFIQEQGHDVELIDYYPTLLEQGYFKHLYQNKYFIFNGIKKWKMNHFSSSQMKIGQPRFRANAEMNVLNQNYDVVICGSDEIWNIKSPLIKFDPVFFLSFITEKNVFKASYAASFGSTIALGEHQEEIAQLLKSFGAIAVRDSNSMRLVNECNLPAVKVVDPTFLSDYSNILSPPKVKRDYILIYGGLTPEEQNYVKQVAQVEGLDTIAIGYPCKAATFNRLTVSPEEWLGYFSKATYIFTNFYHGTIFSLIFRKPFTALSRPDKSVKVKDLLGDLQLEDRILTADMLSGSSSKLSYTLSFDENVLEQMIMNSKSYLTQILEKNSDK
jgi:hypothetical protein